MRVKYILGTNAVFQRQSAITPEGFICIEQSDPVATTTDSRVYECSWAWRKLAVIFRIAETAEAPAVR